MPVTTRTIDLSVALLQVVLGKFIRGTYILGGQIDAGSLGVIGGVGGVGGVGVVVDDDATGPAVHSRGGDPGIPSGLRHTTASLQRRGTVLGQAEEKEIGSTNTDIGVKEFRPSRTAGSCGREKLL